MQLEKGPRKRYALLDLASPAGNVFALIAVARRLAPLTGHCDRVITARMMKGDYHEALAVFDEYFSDFVVLENRPLKAR
jgi:hypothetical protein